MSLANRTKKDLIATTLILVDEMDNAVKKLYGGLPNSAYIIGQDGRVWHKQPWMDSKLLREPLEKLLAQGGVAGTNPPRFALGGVMPGGGGGTPLSRKPVSSFKDAPVRVPDEIKNQIVWGHDLLEAQKLAKQVGVPVLVELQFDGCSFCAAMAAGPLQEKNVVDVSRKYICVKMDLMKKDGEALAESLELVGTPAFAVYNPDGKVVLKHVNYAEADFMAEFLREGLELSQQKSDAAFAQRPVASKTNTPAAPLPGLILKPAETDQEGLEDAQLYDFTYERDDLKLQGVLLKPKGDGPFPAVVVNHAGGQPTGRSAGLNQGRHFVAAGYVVISCDYTWGGRRRGGGQQGQPRRDPAATGQNEQRQRPANDSATSGQNEQRQRGFSNFFNNEVNPRRSSKCVDILQSLPYVDGTKIGMFGHSMGAFLTVTMCQQTDRIKVAAISGGGLRQNGDGIKKVSAPFLILIGDKDRLLGTAKKLKASLDEHGKTSELVIFEGAGHSVISQRRKECYAKIIPWFNQHLAVAAPSIGRGAAGSALRATQPQANRDRPASGGRGGDGFSFTRLAERYDANQDGKITGDEWKGPEQFFDRIDANGDGVIDEAELKKMAERFRGDARPGQGRPGQGRPGQGRPGQGPGPTDPPQQRPADRGSARIPAGVEFVKDIAYRDGNSKAWWLDLAMPKERGDAPRPAIVIVHGGGWRSGDKGGGQWRSLPLQYASKGYVCISVNYRLTGEAPFPACVEDVKCAVRWLRANAKKFNVDPKRFGAYGNSAGAHLVAMLGLVGPDAKLEGDGPYRDQSSLVQAVCCSATPTDFTDWDGRTFRGEGTLLAGPADSLPARRTRASPVSYASPDAPSFLVIHGTADRTVPFSQGEKFVAALNEAGAEDVTFMKFDGAGHGVFGQHSDETHPAMEKFFARTIGAARGAVAPAGAQQGDTNQQPSSARFVRDSGAEPPGGFRIAELAADLTLCSSSGGPKIFWLKTWKQALAEAKRTECPILLAFGAPRCEAVPGVW